MYAVLMSQGGTNDPRRTGAKAVSWTTCRSITGILVEHHYLGPSKRGTAWQDEYGVIIVARPTSRRLPGHWLELLRWCIVSHEKNAGSRQWAAFVRALRTAFPEITTIISYSDPSVGHTGALYRACNWWWAPTWHRLRPPPTGNGMWTTGEVQSVKDRWIFPLQCDPDRVRLLVAEDASILRRWPWAEYREPGGVPFKLARTALEPKP
jgi:hypothetical protein